MRSRVRLSGRKQLSKTCVEVQLKALDGNKYLSFSIAEKSQFSKMPASSRVKIRLFENKFSETVDFGTLGDVLGTARLKNNAFECPSCQLRIVSSEPDFIGKVLGSTDSWTLRVDDEKEDGVRSDGILLFQPHAISPRSWKLEVRDDDYPVVYIDKRIPDSRAWVRTNPVFLSCVLPLVVKEIFLSIFQKERDSGVQWVEDWCRWSDKLMPGSQVPWDEDWEQQDLWLESLVDSFCQKHDFSSVLIRYMAEVDK